MGGERNPCLLWDVFSGSGPLLQVHLSSGSRNSLSVLFSFPTCSPLPAFFLLASLFPFHLPTYPHPFLTLFPFFYNCALSSYLLWDWAPPALTCVSSLPRTWPTSHPGSLIGECWPWSSSAD